MKEDRRRFLAGGAAMLASTRMKAQAEKELRTAMIGIGSRGGGLLKQVLSQQNVKVAAVCDIDPQARDNAQTAAGRDNPRAYTDYRQVLDLKDVDAVVIATPCDLHAEMSAAALEAGKYVYCEKPLGITPEQVKRALDASRRARTFLQIGQQLRYFPGMREAVRLIQEEKILGVPFVIKAQR
ncbi:MAG: Gfo/Idh/MocA family oxidoreductase, partial [Bryobacteraceae bacterium]|nr:Gfo/Idh/MocA family oxidoreductase [Bryobacteraceae bacterium]